MQKAVVENIQVRRQLQIRLVDIANGGGRAPAQKWSGPVCVLVVERARTEGMNVDRDGSRRELKVELRKGAGQIGRVPTIIESTIGHRITVRKNLGRIFVNERDPHLVE